jgi:2,6-dihydroxypseudooxynicotine hydrolase
MTDQNVETLFRHFTWRILSNRIPPWEFEQIKNKLEKWDDWCSEWSQWAERHVKIGDKAAAAGQTLTAGESYITAGLYYHWASFFFTHDQDQFRTALNAKDEVWRKAAPMLEPPMEILEIPFEGTMLPGYLRKPAGIDHPPIVIIVPGGDSSKEELYDLSENILKRGMAILVFDGPGHGAVSLRLKLRPDYEVPCRAVVDYVMDRTDLDTRRLAFGGISFGGLFACRATAFDDRIRASFSISSWYTPAGRWPHMPTLFQKNFKQYMGENAHEVLDSITLEGVAERIKVPLLQVYGGSDPMSPPEEAYRVESEAPGPIKTFVFDEGVHVCNNIHYIVRPLVADWLAEII